MKQIIYTSPEFIDALEKAAVEYGESLLEEKKKKKHGKIVKDTTTTETNKNLNVL